MFKALTSKIKMPRVGPTGRAQNVSLGLGAAAAQISEAVMARVDEMRLVISHIENYGVIICT